MTELEMIVDELVEEVEADNDLNDLEYSIKIYGSVETN